jgi:hypothetical protein
MDEFSYKELSTSLKVVSDITTRIDERTKILVEDNNVFKVRFERVAEIQSALVARLSIIESSHDISNIKNDIVALQEKIEYLSGKSIKIEQDISMMEKSIGQQDNKWANVIDFLYKVATVVIGAIILWKLGIKP